MKIKRELVIYRDYMKDSYRGFEDTNSETVALLIIAFLHFNGNISDEKMKGMIKQLRNKKLLRFLNTYHCKINNKWYNDISMSEVLLELFNETTMNMYMDIEDYLKYVQLFLNKPKNFCIDFIYYQNIKPFLEYCLYRKNNKWGAFYALNSMEITLLNIKSYDSYEYSNSGYCCEDCDGPYDYYKNRDYENYLDSEINKLNIKVVEHLNTKKTESYIRNPIHLKAEKI